MLDMKWIIMNDYMNECMPIWRKWRELMYLAAFYFLWFYNWSCFMICVTFYKLQKKRFIFLTVACVCVWGGE